MATLKILAGAYSSVIATLLFSTNPPSLSILKTSQAGFSPTWITPHPANKSIVYATQEYTAGQIWSFVVNADGSLTKLATISTGGDSPVYVGVSDDQSQLLVPNYGGGQFLSIPLTNNYASFGTHSPIVHFNGSGPNQQQPSSHPHEAVQNGDEVLVPDLGADKIWRLKQSAGSWTIASYIQQAIGSGPRHIIIHNGSLYTVHELDNTLTQHTLPSLSSGVAPQLITTLPIPPADSSNATMHSGGIFLSSASSSFPTQYLYVANRLYPNSAGDTIAIFSINPLKLVKQVRTGLHNMRGIMLGGPNDQYIVAGGQDSGGIKVFGRISGGADLQELASVQGVSSPTGYAFL